MSTQRIGIVGVAFGLLALTPGCVPQGGPAQTFDAKGVKISYHTAGKGEPVILIHGMASSAGINWQLTGVYGDLAKTHRVIALDLPGHGQSDKPASKEAYGAQMVEDIALLLDHLKIKKVHVVGYSLGGMVAVKFAAKYPERVSSLLVGGMGWFREGSVLQKIWGKMPGGKLGPPAEFLQTVGQLAVSEAELKRIDMPVQVLVGDRDPVKQMYVEPLQKVRKDWPVVEIRDAGHFDCIVKPQFREAISAWVKKNTR
jgi:pimeloyl-ACP methyl ester carboxylesterase